MSAGKFLHSMKTRLRHKLLVFSLSCALASSLYGAIRVWDGGGLDGVFSNGVNWDGNNAPPTSDLDTLQIGANTVGAIPVVGFDTGEFKTPSITFLASATAPYTVTTNSTSDSLTLTGTGVAMLNSSPVRQKFELITTTVGAATQTWDGGAQGLIVAQIDLGANHVLTFTGTGTSATTQNEIRGGITGTANSGLTKTGTGTLLLNNPGQQSDYTGPTTLVNGRLQLGRAHQISNASKLVLNGGIFDTGGFSDTMGVLVLGGSATIDFGTTDTVSLIFGDSRLELWSAGTLLITNFTVGSDTLRFGLDGNALTQAQLNQISFNGMAAMITSTGFVQPIPEPGVPAITLLGLGILGFTCRRGSRAATA